MPEPPSSGAHERAEATDEVVVSLIPASQEGAAPVEAPPLPRDAPPQERAMGNGQWAMGERQGEERALGDGLWAMGEGRAEPEAPPVLPMIAEPPEREEETTAPEEIPLWRSRTWQAFAWLFGLALIFHQVDKDGSFDLLSGLLHKTLDQKDKEDLLEDGSEGGFAVVPSPGMIFGPKASNLPSVIDEEPPLPPPVRPGAESKPFTGQAVEDPCTKTEGEACARYAMDPFYASLEKVLRGEPGAITRLTHFGDSIIASDYISSRVRERMASTFGDAGQGFVYLGKPSRWYHLGGVTHNASDGWVVRGITGRKAPDALYGLGGASFEALSPGQKASFGTSRKKEQGKNVSRFEVYYLEQPGGGVMELLVDGEVRQKLSTHAEAPRAAFHQVLVEDGPHTLTVRSGSARVRAFGVVMERDSPGVVYDSLGLVSGSAKALLSINEEHWEAQLAHRAPHLVVLMFGTNEANYTSSAEESMAEYQGNLEKLLARIRAARPEAACLLMSPPDSAERKGERLVTKAVIPKLVEAQRRAAFNSGCGYWDTFTWMGGSGSMAKWFKKGLGQSDYAHPTRRGAARIGDAFFDALMAGYDAYAARKKASE